MATREEIREGMLTPLIKQYLTGKRLTVIDYNRIVDEQQDCLHSQGVVIKVDRGLPSFLQIDAPEGMGKAIDRYRDILTKAGYEATIPLIEEEK